MNMYNVSFQCRLFLVTRLHEPCTEDYGFQCLYMMYYMQMLFLVTTNKAPNLCTTIYIYIYIYILFLVTVLILKCKDVFFL